MAWPWPKPGSSPMNHSAAAITPAPPGRTRSGRMAVWPQFPASSRARTPAQRNSGPGVISGAAKTSAVSVSSQREVTVTLRPKPGSSPMNHSPACSCTPEWVRRACSWRACVWPHCPWASRARRCNRCGPGPKVGVSVAASSAVAPRGRSTAVPCPKPGSLPMNHSAPVSTLPAAWRCTCRWRAWVWLHRPAASRTRRYSTCGPGASGAVSAWLKATVPPGVKLMVLPCPKPGSLPMNHSPVITWAQRGAAASSSNAAACRARGMQASIIAAGAHGHRELLAQRDGVRGGEAEDAGDGGHPAEAVGRAAPEGAAVRAVVAGPDRGRADGELPLVVHRAPGEHAGHGHVHLVAVVGGHRCGAEQVVHEHVVTGGHRAIEDVVAHDHVAQVEGGVIGVHHGVVHELAAEIGRWQQAPQEDIVRHSDIGDRLRAALHGEVALHIAAHQLDVVQGRAPVEV